MRMARTGRSKGLSFLVHLMLLQLLLLRGRLVHIDIVIIVVVVVLNAHCRCHHRFAERPVVVILQQLLLLLLLVLVLLVMKEFLLQRMMHHARKGVVVLAAASSAEHANELHGAAQLGMLDDAGVHSSADQRRQVLVARVHVAKAGGQRVRRRH